MLRQFSIRFGCKFSFSDSSKLDELYNALSPSVNVNALHLGGDDFFFKNNPSIFCTPLLIKVVLVTIFSVCKLLNIILRVN